MAQVMVAVDDPLGVRAEVGQRPSPLLLDTYVRVEIEGRELEDVVPVPRTALHGDEEVWVADSDDRLRPREVEVAWRERGRIFVSSGLQEGERVVTTPLAIATDGMKVTVAEPARESSSLEVAAATGEEGDG